MKTSIPDLYDLEARYVPALVCSLPFIFLGYYFLNGLDGSFWHSAFAATIGSLGLSAALYSVDVHFCRAIGKLIEEKIFRGGLDFPTTKFLLDDDINLSNEQKKRVLAKIKAKFRIDLRGKTNGDDSGSREIHEALGQIRSTFYKKNKMILQRNIQFGLTRNLLAGCILAVVASAGGSILSLLANNDTALTISLVLLASYGLLAIGSFAFLHFMARQYAHTLFNEFLAAP